MSSYFGQELRQTQGNFYLYRALSLFYNTQNPSPRISSGTLEGFTAHLQGCNTSSAGVCTLCNVILDSTPFILVSSVPLHYTVTDLPLTTTRKGKQKHVQYQLIQSLQSERERAERYWCFIGTCSVTSVEYSLRVLGGKVRQ